MVSCGSQVNLLAAAYLWAVCHGSAGNIFKYLSQVSVCAAASHSYNRYNFCFSPLFFFSVSLIVQITAQVAQLSSARPSKADTLNERYFYDPI